MAQHAVVASARRAGYKFSQWHQLVAEKNLLKVKLSNLHVYLQLFNNKTRQIVCHANTREELVRDALVAAREGRTGRLPTADTQAAVETARLFSERLHERGLSRITFLRPKHTRFTGRAAPRPAAHCTRGSDRPSLPAAQASSRPSSTRYGPTISASSPTLRRRSRRARPPAAAA